MPTPTGIGTRTSGRTTTPAHLLALLETEPRTDNTDCHKRHTEYDAVGNGRSQCNIKTILEDSHNGIDAGVINRHFFIYLHN